MKNTSLKQKMLLFIFGLALTVILLEIGLRIAGMFVLFLQERHNHLSFNQNEYRILCLGESTTALGGEDSYPSQLEAMLNAQVHQKKFTVINKGIISTTTDYILTHLDQNLDSYKPQMVIVMMGINDKAYLRGPYKSLWWENIKLYLKDFRVYKLAHLLYEHITHRIKNINAPVTAPIANLSEDEEGNSPKMENFLKLVIVNSIQRFSQHMSAVTQYQQDKQLDQAKVETQFAQEAALEATLSCVELARRYRLQGSLQEAQSYLEQATNIRPDHPSVSQEWGELYMAQGNPLMAVKAFQTSFALDPKNSDVLLGLAHAYRNEHVQEAFLVYDRYLQMKPEDYWGHIELAKWLREDKHYALAEEYLNRAIEISPGLYQAYLDFGLTLDEAGQFSKEEDFYLKQISLDPKKSFYYDALGRLYQKQGKKDQAQTYFQKAAQRQMAEYCPVTLVNYSLLLDKILSRHIKVVVMQYPLRDIGSLKDYLGQKEGVIFVENKNNFQQALTKEGYTHYFKDNFAYNFGHCTRAGNELIALNLINVILKK